MRLPVKLTYPKLLEQSLNTGPDLAGPRPEVVIDQLTERSMSPTSGFFFDVVHPNRQGHALIATRLSAMIGGLLPRK